MRPRSAFRIQCAGPALPATGEIHRYMEEALHELDRTMQRCHEVMKTRQIPKLFDMLARRLPDQIRSLKKMRQDLIFASYTDRTKFERACRLYRHWAYNLYKIVKDYWRPSSETTSQEWIKNVLQTLTTYFEDLITNPSFVTLRSRGEEYYNGGLKEFKDEISNIVNIHKFIPIIDLTGEDDVISISDIIGEDYVTPISGLSGGDDESIESTASRNIRTATHHNRSRAYGGNRDVIQPQLSSIEPKSTFQRISYEGSPPRGLAEFPSRVSETSKADAGASRPEHTTKNFNFPPSLPQFIDIILQPLLRSYSEPPVPEGKVRVRWKSRYGVPFFDDLTELVPGSLQKIETDLQMPDDSGSGTQSPWQTISDALETIWESIEFPTHQERSSDIELGTRLRDRVIELPPSSTQLNGKPAIEPGTLRLLLYIGSGNSGTSMHKLHQVELDGVSTWTDHTLFQKLRETYFGRQSVKNWFTIRYIKSVSLVKFSLDSSKRTEIYKCNDSSQSNSLRSGDTTLNCCSCLPPMDRIPTEYKCDPAPETIKFLPPAPSALLTKSFLYPEEINPESRFFIRQLPKRVSLLRVADDRLTVAWGVHFEEGVHWLTIYVIYSGLVLLSLLFAIVWSIVKKDIQAAFTISSYFITLGCVFLGYAVLRAA